jgi:hypothetical protein
MKMLTLVSDIERALDDIVSNEDDVRFQRLATVLAKEKWPGLIASERKRDLGRDALAPAALAEEQKGKALACSITARLPKVMADVKKICRETPAPSTVIFSTPCRVTEYTKKQWTAVIRNKCGVELVIVSREDILTDLLKPMNAPLCRDVLGISVAVEPDIAELIDSIRTAAREVGENWRTHARLAGKPIIPLNAIVLDQSGPEARTVLSIEALHDALRTGGRIVLEGIAGAGKTTTLTEVAALVDRQGGVGLLVDLPELLRSGRNLIEFLASQPQCLVRGITTEKLANALRNVSCSFLLNGWNEVSEAFSEAADGKLREIDRDFPTAGIIVATRAGQVRPPLRGLSVRLLAVSRARRSEYVHQVAAGQASELLARLEGDSALDQLTRTPMILAAVVTLFLSGRPIPKTRLGVLEAVVQLMEMAGEHHGHLQRAPLLGHSGRYLIELAAQATAKGAVMLTDSDARGAVAGVSKALQAESQITGPPEPAAVLSVLCDHHIIERVDSAAFKFQHQQFQEFYSAQLLKRELSSLVESDNPTARRQFTRDYINRPAWEEPLRMLAEEVGQYGLEHGEDPEIIAKARCLIEMTLDVDPVFAADLSRLCGAKAWREVGPLVSKRLRAWYADADDHHRLCALGAMLASGSKDFADVILPLLTNDDEQVRLRTYRAWQQFHVSSLGLDWRPLVAAWTEDQRANFAGELAMNPNAAEVAEDLARSDPSLKVRIAAIHALRFAGAFERLGRALNVLDDSTLEELLRIGALDYLPDDLKPRALQVGQKLLEKTQPAMQRISNLLDAAKMGAQNIADKIKNELTDIGAGGINYDDQWFLKSVLEFLRPTDSEWISHWLIDKILEGAPIGKHFKPLIGSMSETQRTRAIEQVANPDVDLPQHHRLSEGVAMVADSELCGTLFSRIAEIRPHISRSSANDEDSKRSGEMVYRSVRFLRTLSPSIVVAGVLRGLSREFTETEYDIVIDIFGVGRDGDSELGDDLDTQAQEQLSEYLKRGASYVRSLNDYVGERKAYLATALARVGAAEDLNLFRELIRADIDRMRVGRAARSRREQGQMANDALMTWTSWYINAAVGLASEKAVSLLLELLQEPEYEGDAAAGLLRLARLRAPERAARSPFPRRDYSKIWEVREGRQLIEFQEQRRAGYASAVRDKISALLEAGKQSPNPGQFYGRARKLAVFLAALDARNSGDLVLEIMVLPANWDEWRAIEAMEALLFGGARLKTAETLKVVDKVIEAISARGTYDQQHRYLLQRCLEILPFLDQPEKGTARIREVLATTALHGFELRGLFDALGNSRCPEALGLLLELASSNGNALRGAGIEWIDAVAALDTVESKQVLLSFVDRDLKSSFVPHRFEHHEVDALASHIADVARVDTAVRDRLYRLCSSEMEEARRILLARIVGRLRTEDALIAGLNLLRDDVDPPVPFDLARSLEEVFVQRRSEDESRHTYTPEPRASNAIRARLFEMSLRDDRRKAAAWSLLGQIEIWRIEYGRLANEPRHPEFDSGLPWPPIVNTPSPHGLVVHC